MTGKKAYQTVALCVLRVDGTCGGVGDMGVKIDAILDFPEFKGAGTINVLVSPENVDPKTRELQETSGIKVWKLQADWSKLNLLVVKNWREGVLLTFSPGQGKARLPRS